MIQAPLIAAYPRVPWFSVRQVARQPAFVPVDAAVTSRAMY